MNGLSVTENLATYLRKSLLRDSLRELCATHGLSARGTVPELAQRIASSWEPADLLRKVKPEDRFSWSGKLFLRALLDGPKDKQGILNHPCLQPVFQFVAENKAFPSWYKEGFKGFKESFLRVNHKHLMKHGVVSLNRKGLTYVINAPFDKRLQPFLEKINSENSLELYKQSPEYEWRLRQRSQSSLLDELHRKDEILNVGPPIQIPEVAELRRFVVFSDYRVQDIDLLTDFMKSLDPRPDLILYAGDDVDRFGPLPEDFLRKRAGAAKRLPTQSLRSTDVAGMYLFNIKVNAGEMSPARAVVQIALEYRETEKKIEAAVEQENPGTTQDLESIIRSVLSAVGQKKIWLNAEKNTLTSEIFELDIHRFTVQTESFEASISAFSRPEGSMTVHLQSAWLDFARRVFRASPNADADDLASIFEKRAIIISNLHSKPSQESASGVIYFAAERENRFQQLASLSNYGLFAVLGNDDSGSMREVIKGRKVFNVHLNPVLIGQYAVIGQEAAPIKPDQVNPGVILYREEGIREHLVNFLPFVEGKRMIIVSHAPPRDVLDHALRYGERNIGSDALRDFIEKHENIALVVCGHVHYCGMQSEHLGSTLVVNAASHDTRGEPGRIAVLDFSDSGQISIQWTLLHELQGIFDIGPAKAARLKDAGIRRVEDLLKFEPDEIVQRTGFSPRAVDKLTTRAKAITEGRIYPLQAFTPPPTPRIYVDIETDLAQEQVWLIGVYSESSSTYTHFFAESPQQEKAILEDFLKLLSGEESATICTFSGSDFEKRVLKARLEAHGLDVDVTEKMIDICYEIRASVALPLKSYALKSIAPIFQYMYKHPSLDGWRVSLMYFDEYLESRDQKLRTTLIEYNRDDVMVLPHIIKSLERMAVS